MKRILGSFLLLAVLLGSAGCGDTKNEAGKPGAPPPPPPPGPTKAGFRGGPAAPRGVE